jgi:hypothetical protein
VIDKPPLNDRQQAFVREYFIDATPTAEAMNGVL